LHRRVKPDSNHFVNRVQIGISKIVIPSNKCRHPCHILPSIPKIYRLGNNERKGEITVNRIHNRPEEDINSDYVLKINEKYKLTKGA
jgi:hypothetical protein